MMGIAPTLQVVIVNRGFLGSDAPTCAVITPQTHLLLIHLEEGGQFHRQVKIASQFELALHEVLHAIGCA